VTPLAMQGGLRFRGLSTSVLHMTTTQTRQVDHNGNVSYRIDRNGVAIGSVLRMCSGYHAVLTSGSWAPVKSVKAGAAWVEAYA
jgi:hypothetical protein